MPHLKQIYKREQFYSVLTETRIKVTPFWDVGPCSLDKGHRRFGSAYCLHHQGNESP
jgi:hypothetical protein